MRICFECGGHHSELIVESGDSRQWCRACFAGFSNRRYWAQKRDGEPKVALPGDVASGLCFHCKFQFDRGVFRMVKRSKNESAKKTWVCWKCDGKRPTLGKWS